jgi:lysozyme family protein
MIKNFEHALKFVFFWEKYMSNNPKDPGGLTIWGFSSKYFPDEVNAMLGMNPQDAKEYASQLAKLKKWDVIDGDNLSHLMDIVLFDCAFNQGEGRAKAIARNACNWADAIILRYDYYDDFQSFNDFGKGWSKRAVSLRNYIVTNFRVLEWDPKELVKSEI